MHLIKPSWLCHKGDAKDHEVYSCHVSPDGKRLATAGGDGNVRVWSTEAIYQSNDASYTKPRQLAHMSHHLGTIHTVRFSPNGRYLASGADDKIICIYQLDPNPPPHTSSGPVPAEHWKTHRRLVGHDNDVQDLAWSHDASILVSVGLDSKIVVWSGHTFEKLKTIAVHQSHVKGVTFDPANKFFATASDDRTVKIFKFTSPPPNATQHDLLNNFVLETTISDPFRGSPLTTYFRRCSWSPDGNHIAAPNAVNGPVSSVAIIERGRWDSDINLIGHEGPTEACVFSPRLFYAKKPTNNSTNGTNGTDGTEHEPETLVTVMASAGQDKTLCIWNTNTTRPLIILQDIAGKAIADLAWTPDGQAVFATSLDGTIVVARFEEGELGWVAQAEEVDKALQRFGAARRGMGIAEDVDGLQLETQSKAGELRGAESRMGRLMGDVSGKEATDTSDPPTPAPKTAEEETAEKRAARIDALKSRVTITKDGRKRVMPMLVSSAAAGPSTLPQTQLVGVGAGTGAGKTNPNDAPQTTVDLSRPFDGLPDGGIAALLLGTKRKSAVAETEDETGDPAAKRAAAGPTTGPSAILVSGVEGTEPATLQAPPTGIVPTPTYLRPAVVSPALLTANVRLAVPKVRAHILRPLEKGVLLGDRSLEDASRIPENLILEAKNSDKTRHPTHVTVTKRGALVWQDFLPRAVLLVTGSKHFWAAACEDGSVHVWTPAGRRLINAMVLDAQPVILECRDHWLLCLTAVGLAHVWDMRTMQAPHPPVSLAPVLDAAVHSLSPHGPTAGPGVTSASLNSNGHIVVTLTSGDGYYYAPNLFAWQRLSEAWWAVGSQYWNSNDTSLSALATTAVGPVSDPGDTGVSVAAGIIPYLERHTTSEFLLKGRAYSLQRLVKNLLADDTLEGFEASVSIAHLENRIAGALQLGARDEFRLYLLMYAKRLGSENLRGKIEELLNSLVGGVLRDAPSDGADTSSTSLVRGPAFGWFSRDGEICGWDRTELLKGVVMVLGKHRELQRLTVQYARVLGLTRDDDFDDAMSVDA